MEASGGTVPSCRVMAYHVVPQIMAQTITPTIPSNLARDSGRRTTGAASVGEDMRPT